MIDPQTLPLGAIRFRPAAAPTPPAVPFTEEARRRDSFADKSVAVVFGDGSTWSVPRPSWWMRAVFEGRKAVGTIEGFGYGAGDQADELVEQLAEQPADSEWFLSTVATLAAVLLRRNYELSDDELDRLLCFRTNDPASYAWLEAVVTIATGRTPE